MDFGLTDEQQGLIEATRALLDRKAPLTATRGYVEAPVGFDPEVWRLGVELGWPALAVPEQDGGLGQGLVELTLVAAELGRSLTPMPFLPTVVVADALVRSSAAGRAKVLESLLDGTATAAWAFTEHQRPWSVDGMETTAERRPDGYALSGTKVEVQDADSARWLLVDARLDGQPARFIVPADAAGVSITPESTLDVARNYSDVELVDVFVPNDALVSSGAEAATDISRSCAVGTLLACAELIGISEQLLAMTVDYAGKRMQFGRAIGSFQAIKHKCADMRIWGQSIKASTYFAALALGSDAPADEQARAVSAAKAYASEAIGWLAGEALQIHGGIGFTWEHDLHLYLRRGRTNALVYGDATHHREVLCALAEAAKPGAAATA